jgi:succinate dehydrogenase (ubiquinone) cytochrome b560 subunit
MSPKLPPPIFRVILYLLLTKLTAIAIPQIFRHTTTAVAHIPNLMMLSTFSRRLPKQQGLIALTPFRSFATYTEKQEKTGILSPSHSHQLIGRPLSPHVSIYAFPTVAISSIAIRGTGIGLAFGFYGAGIASLAGLDVADLMTTLGSSPVGPLAKFTVAFPFVYHYAGGIRHFVWDFFPETTVDNKTAESSSYAIFGVTAAGCLLASMVSI